MKPCLKRFDVTDEYFFPEGCYITEVSNSEDDPALSIVRARVEPGVSTRWHYLEGITERYVILDGLGEVEIDGELKTVGRGDIVIFPPGCRQRISNTGKDDLIFLAICSPRFVPVSYFDCDR